VSHRREVRVSEEFFRQLDSQLGPTRGSAGEPSSTDYLIIELPAIVERFATDFDSLAEFVDGVHAARMLITTGVLAPASVVYGLEVADGGIELIGVMLDLGQG
jgi:hypothetical protein